VDNGPEFLAQPFVDWCAAHRVACQGVARAVVREGLTQEQADTVHRALLRHLARVTASVTDEHPARYCQMLWIGRVS
jgi:hypothetical protein